MAFKLSKADMAAKAEHVAQLRALWAKVELEVETANGAIAAIVDDTNMVIRAYNQYAQGVSDWAHSIGEAHRETFDEKSENWQQGDIGQSAEEFINHWEGLQLDGASESKGLEIELDEDSSADSVEELPDEA